MKKSAIYVEWSDKHNVGVRVIDKQHIHFIGIMNKLFEAMQTDEEDAIPKIIDELIKYADSHFETEEKYFEKLKYPGAKEHIAEHNKIKVKIIRLLAKKNPDQFKLGFELLDLLEDWLFKHLATMDTKFAAFLNKKGVR